MNLVTLAATHPILSALIAQSTTGAPAGTGGAGAAGGAASSGGMTMLQQINNGGTTGYTIILLSFVALTIAIVHLIAVRPKRLMPPELTQELANAIYQRDIPAALDLCTRPGNDCFLTRVLKHGLTRYSRSALGPFEFKDALEEAGSEQVAHLYRATDVLGLIGAIAPMLGLLGTVIGMVGAFSTIATAGARPELLAADISKALITTLEGLCVAIPTSAVFTYLRNRIDSYASQVASLVEEMVVPLEPAYGVPAAGPAAAPQQQQQQVRRPASAAAPMQQQQQTMAAGAGVPGGGVAHQPVRPGPYVQQPQQ